MIRFSVSVVLIIILVTFSQAQDQRKSREVTIIGEVIDPKCYFLDVGRGKEHAECALQCARSGIPLAILEQKTDFVYFAAKARGTGGANDMLIPFIGEQVSVKGKLVEKGGTRLLLLETVEKAK